MSNIVYALHDSILAGTGVPADESFYVQTGEWYDSNNFQVTWSKVGIGGRSLYEVAPTGFSPDGSYIPGLPGSRPSIDTNGNSTYAIAQGCDILFVECTTNMIGADYVETNPTGYNDASDESMDILAAIKSECDLNSVDMVVMTPPPRASSDSTRAANSNTLSQRIRDNYDYLDANTYLGDGTVNNYLTEKYTTDNVHPNAYGHAILRGNFIHTVLDKKYNTRG
jgi:lysophospholipase L1-like esterase